MTEAINEQLDKILALADSSHDGEALVAVRKARQVLSRGGLNFSDLARAASSRQIMAKIPAGFSFLPGQREHLESQMAHLRAQIDDLRGQLQTQDLQLDFWRRRAADLEQIQAQAVGDAERWKKLARETAERLWDIGQSIKGEEFSAKTPVPEKAAVKK